MNLNIVDKNKIKRMIEEKVMNIPYGKNIKIDKAILEELLFHKEKDNRDRTVKFISWSGDFLNKIDLSEINFDDVIWDLNFCKKYEKVFKNNPYIDMKSINFSNTNANIDFSKSYEGKYITNKDLTISNCNFENMKNIIGFEIFNVVVNCSLKNSSAVLSLRDNKVLGNKIINSNLEGINLDKLEIDVKDLVDSSGKHCFFNTYIKNTNLRIKYNYKRPIGYKEKLETYYRLKEKDLKNEMDEKRLANLTFELKSFIKLDEYGKKLGQLIQNGELVGCYVNDKFIKPKEMAQNDRKLRIEQLKKEKEELIKSLENSIDNQILKLRSNKGTGCVKIIV